MDVRQQNKPKLRKQVQRSSSHLNSKASGAREKLNEMVRLNPAIKNLIKTFDLRLIDSQAI